MLCNSCKTEPVVRGLKKCSTPNCKNTTYSNFAICSDCSEKSNRCAKCGQPLGNITADVNQELNFIFPKVRRNKQHILWYEGVTPKAMADFGNGVIVIRSNGNTVMELVSFEKGRIFSVNEEHSGKSIADLLTPYVQDDKELEKIINGTHEEMYARIEEIKSWKLYYLEGNNEIFLGSLNSNYLPEAVKQVEEGSDHLSDLIRISMKE